VTILRWLSLFVAVAAVPAGAQEPERRVLAGEEVAIHVLAGRVRLEGGPGPAVVAEVWRRGRDAAQVRVEVGLVDGRETLRVYVPGRRIVYPGMRSRRVEARVRRDGTLELEGGGLAGFFRRGVEIMRDGDGVEAHADVRVLVPLGRRVAVHLAAGEVGVVGVDGRIEVRTKAAPVRVERVAGSIEIRADGGPVSVRDATGAVAIRSRRGGVDLARVGGPRLSVRTSAGSIAGSDLSASEVSLVSQAGSLDLARVRGGRLVLDSGAGSISGVELAAGSLEVDLEAGDLELFRVRADTLRVDVGSGNVALELAGPVAAASVEAGGAVTLAVPPWLDAELVIRSDGGAVEADVPFQVIEQREGYLRGWMGSGSGRVVIESDDGPVRLIRAPLPAPP
jgi:lia operon protein LiaG